MKKIFLTGDIHPDAAALLARHAKVVVASDTSSRALAAGVVDADVIVVRHPLPAGIFDHAVRLRAAIRHGAGVDMIPVHEASQHGIVVANVPGINAEFVAEHVMGQMINLSRRLVHVQTAFRRHSWQRGKDLAMGGFRLKGKTVGIVGFGAVGRAVANICRNGFAMNVVAAKRAGQAHPPEQGVERLALADLLAISDFVVLCCPLTKETEGLINEAAFARMKPTAYLLNVARGRVVDSGALIQALLNETIAGAALDVYEETPLRRDSPFFDLENLLLTPHVAAVTADSMKMMGDESAMQAVEILQGKYPANWVNIDAKEKIDARWRSLDGLR